MVECARRTAGRKVLEVGRESPSDFTTQVMEKLNVSHTSAPYILSTIHAVSCFEYGSKKDKIIEWRGKTLYHI